MINAHAYLLQHVYRCVSIMPYPQAKLYSEILLRTRPVSELVTVS